MLGIDDKTVRAIATLPTRHTWMAEIMSLPDLEQAEERLDEWVETQVEQMFPGNYPVKRAARTILPFLMEKEAISLWAEKHPQWKGYLPEVSDPDEAATLAELELQERSPELHRKIKEALEKLSKMPKPELSSQAMP